jgi:hypothetical protein
LKDVIEHIHDQAKLIGWMKNFLRTGGIIFSVFLPGTCHLAGISKWLVPGYQDCHTSIYFPAGVPLVIEEEKRAGRSIDGNKGYRDQH